MFAVEVNAVEAIKTVPLALVDFWSPNCPHCLISLPAIENLAETYLGQLWVMKVQAEKNPEAMAAFNVQHLPTFIIFKDGNEIDRIVGGQRFSNLQMFARKVLDA